MNLLTDAEREAMNVLADLANRFNTIVGSGPTRSHDMDEIVLHIHALQRTLMAQAGGRAYPDKFRLLGEVIGKPPVARGGSDIG